MAPRSTLSRIVRIVLFSVVALLVAHASIAPSRAPAQARLTSGGIDLELFRPAIDSKGFFSVDGTDILGDGDISFGLVIDGAIGVGAFEGFVNDDNALAANAERVDHLVDQLFTATLQGSYGIADRAVVGLQVPIRVVSGPNTTIPGQWNDGTSSGLGYQGLGDLVLHGKLRLLRVEQEPVGLAIVARAGIPTGDESQLAGEPGAWLWPTAVVEWRPVGRLRIAVEAGYRLALGDGGTLRIGGRTTPGADNATGPVLDTTRGHDVTWDDVLTFGAGASLRIADPIDLVAEASATQIASAIGSPHTLSAETLFGIKVFVERNSYLTLGAGVGIGDGIQTPDVRGVIGFVFEPSIGDRDGDGYKDDVDQCPDEPEDFDDFGDSDGCPDPDNDRDGILDVDDECTMVPEDRDGDADDDGCPEGNEGDRDGDGILDDADQCPDDPEDRDGFRDEDGCPDPDNDQDGILDVDDLCPNDAEDRDGFRDEDGCPDPDNDEDRILDVNDACPNDPEKYNGTEDEDGCPDVGVIDMTGDGVVFFEKIQFETDSARIVPESYHILDAISSALMAHTEITLVEIQGHADERASDDYNIRLTRDRAAAVMQGLIDRGIARSRMRAGGYGERCPVDPRHNAVAWEANRRVEIKIIATTSGPTGVEVACPAGRELIPRE